MTTLPLTPEQAEQLRPFFDKANAPLSQSVILCQALRLDWTQGAALVLAVKVIERRHAEKLRKLLAKLENQQTKAANRKAKP